jgi:hypothetical protein
LHGADQRVLHRVVVLDGIDPTFQSRELRLQIGNLLGASMLAILCCNIWKGRPLGNESFPWAAASSAAPDMIAITHTTTTHKFLSTRIEGGSLSAVVL